jgi:hypothetical protein
MINLLSDGGVRGMFLTNYFPTLPSITISDGGPTLANATVHGGRVTEWCHP